jgi:protein ImuB
LAARFGEILLRRIDQALGCEEESIVPLLPVPFYVVERRFAEPIAREDDVLGTITHLATELGRVLERHGEGARLLQVALFRADGEVMRIGIGTGEPLRDPLRIRRLFTDRLAVLADEYDPGFGFDMVRLSALKTERREETQTGLGGGDEAQELAHLVDRLGARFGARRVSRIVPNDTHIPEYAVLEVAASLPSPLRGGSTAKRSGWGSFGGSLKEVREHGQDQDSLAPTRPIRLFEHAEPIEAIAEIPDGPPVRFRWRRVLHEVAHVEGPERIAMQWWRTENGSKLTRDYFRIESRDGIRAWLYREGLYGRELKSNERPRWYVHGLFA